MVSGSQHLSEANPSTSATLHSLDQSHTRVVQAPFQNRYKFSERMPMQTVRKKHTYPLNKDNAEGWETDMIILQGSIIGNVISALSPSRLNKKNAH